ncbi:MAG: response regulator [Frankiales bacterium]|nr:response regulator [Frankiales bacterium]
MTPLALVVDDEDSIRLLIEVTLQMEGYRVITAADGPTALALAATHRPDVVTLDIMMPGMTGWEVAQHLGQDPFTRHVPIVVVSGKPMTELESAPDRSLASAVLSKPFDFATFVEVVASVLKPQVPSQRTASHDVRARQRS